MEELEHIFTDKPQDYQRVRAETISLVNAVSNTLSGLGNLQAGVSLVYPAENIEESGKDFTRIFFLSPVEMVKTTLDAAALAHRLREVVSATPVRLVKRKHKVFLDTKSAEYQALESRILSIIEAARANFRRDTVELMALYEAYTQPSASIPKAGVFHLRAAFDHRELFSAYRAANGLPEPAPPTLTKEHRDSLTSRGISTHGIPDRSPAMQGVAHDKLPGNALQLREAVQGMEYGKEVQMILHVLGDAIVRGHIPTLVMDAEFRSELQRVIEAARRTPEAQQPAMWQPITQPLSQ